MVGRISSFQSLGTVDGPGVRSVVFMQGCPLRCICCHNPETWDFSGGEEVTASGLAEKVLRFVPYFGRFGGVTVSGGEPLCQPEFLTEFFRILHKSGVHTALDTSGALWDPAIAELIGETDLIILDHKYPTADAYEKNARASKYAVERFLSEVDSKNVPVWLRRVIIPGYTDGEGGAKSLISLARSFKCVCKVEFLPFRDLCLEKYRELGIPFPLEGVPSPSRDLMSRLDALIPPELR